MTKVLPQSVVDALRPLVEKYGGIGAGRDRDLKGCPLCIHGYASAIERTWIRDVLLMAGITRGANDQAVRAFNESRGFTVERAGITVIPRLTLDEWLLANHVTVVPDYEYTPIPITYGTYA